MSAPVWRHIVLVRHGETDENARGILQGHAPTRLNAQGRRQADAVAGRLGKFTPRLEALVSSDLARAKETAAPIERATRLTARDDAAWRERGFGPWEGRTLDEADIWRAAAGAIDLPGAEPLAAFQTRVRGALQDLARDASTPPCVGVVTHGGAMRTVLRLLTDGTLLLAEGEPVPELAPIPNCSIMHLQVRVNGASDPVWRITCVNDVDHLAANGRAPTRPEADEALVSDGDGAPN